jgi:hypothetical protein
VLLLKDAVGPDALTPVQVMLAGPGLWTLHVQVDVPPGAMVEGEQESPSTLLTVMTISPVAPPGGTVMTVLPVSPQAVTVIV